jgi:hypothetical protein
MKTRLRLVGIFRRAPMPASTTLSAAACARSPGSNLLVVPTAGSFNQAFRPHATRRSSRLLRSIVGHLERAVVEERISASFCPMQ